MTLKKNIILFCALGLLASAVSPTAIVFADSITNSEQRNDEQFDPDFQINGSILEENGFTSKEIEAFNNYESPGIYLENGKAFINGVEQLDMQRGKFTWAVKAIRKVWNKLPAGVRNTISGYVGINGFLNLIEHYTGTLENAIFNACKKVGMPTGVANFVTKTIMLFI
ncbi:hypothetical protein [Enterococcus caccae]|uniref:Uncharacterized protein n=1 Tax=Enterococcus caccae ATCC BAA-1240 TaxID=1158612 RepID=R3WVY6_9ENTE|nr:hypothetical protein [Enterococcus caccae]EOL45950.1 hypothetical protein UC7_01747 [Enterococcus caccae ATCC BAA-1240]EOT61146.1 hypothetical protein I580_02048 [Enterococcus caccae ATCC BAA-1240]OJG27823.1 hypothetical protein RU98_GL002032 [Enterococcus caccae]